MSFHFFAELHLVCTAKMVALATTHGYPVTKDSCSNPTACTAICVTHLGDELDDLA